MGKSSPKKKPIVKLVNRKACKTALFNRKTLQQLFLPKGTRLLINEYLSSYYLSQTAHICRKLKRANKITKVYIVEWVVHIVRKTKKILHQSQLYELSPILILMIVYVLTEDSTLS